MMDVGELVRRNNLINRMVPLNTSYITSNLDIKSITLSGPVSGYLSYRIPIARTRKPCNEGTGSSQSEK